MAEFSDLICLICLICWERWAVVRMILFLYWSSTLTAKAIQLQTSEIKSRLLLRKEASWVRKSHKTIPGLHQASVCNIQCSQQFKSLSLRSLRRCILAPWHFLTPTNSQNSQTRYFELYTYFLTLLRVPIFKAAAYFI